MVENIISLYFITIVISHLDTEELSWEISQVCVLFPTAKATQLPPLPAQDPIRCMLLSGVTALRGHLPTVVHLID